MFHHCGIDVLEQLIKQALEEILTWIPFDHADFQFVIHQHEGRRKVNTASKINILRTAAQVIPPEWRSLTFDGSGVAVVRMGWRKDHVDDVFGQDALGLSFGLHMPDTTLKIWLAPDVK